MMVGAWTKLERALLRASNMIRVDWIRREPETWLSENLGSPLMHVPKASIRDEIERLAIQTNRLGALPIWEGYQAEWQHAARTPALVRANPILGAFYTHLVVKKAPSLVVEFGTAFGVSGMYWLCGLEVNGHGELLTFEPNTVWANIARKNLSAISNRFQLINGTFEEHIDLYLGGDRFIDVALIDAIHTSEYVLPQLALVRDRLAPGGIVLLDDIDFSAEMSSCWAKIANDDRVKASAAISGRVGVLEF